MSIRVNVNGTLRGANELHVSALDRGFLYGDSVYEVIRTYEGQPYALGLHLDRLWRSAEMLEIGIPVTRTELIERVRGTVTVAANKVTYIRIVVTRGAGEIALDPAYAVDPLVVVIVAPLRRIPVEWQEDGIRAALVPVGRGPEGSVPGGAKSGNYLANLMALGRARRSGAEEAILVDTAGLVTEGASSNVFAVREGRLLTPALDRALLEGITRGLVLDVARSIPLPVEERDVRPDELLAADEVFLTSTLREIVPVVRIDENRIGEGLPGRMTDDLLRRFRERIPALLGWDEGTPQP
jgi:branched-chain amino acid aminotransferase